ncbi:site-specific integrase [Methanolobus vulcani]|uniref:Site-specific integrase n=1 Tax=Methanolobus vulcani TaxID=38026 RepID=A0A7Z8KLJ1_9EURY|nr:site-specific integrase [Methanolobus vulcani]TQD23586.1 site-specific integrase [Methanolobus vulcani]
MKVNEIKNDPAIRRLFRIRGIKSENTINLYISAFVLFAEFTGFSPSKILEIAQSEYDEGIKPHMMSHFELIGSFREYLEKSTSNRKAPYAPSSIKCYVDRIKSFFTTYYLPVPATIRSVEVRAKPRIENQKLPNRELILKTIKIASIRDKAIILVGVSSGLAASDICTLTVKDFMEGYDPATEITTLSLRRQKTQIDFTTFLSPEASRAVKTYLMTRESACLKSKMMNDVMKVIPESPLFIKNKNFYKYLYSKKEQDRALNAYSLSKNIYPPISKRIEGPIKPGTFRLIRSHNMRKYFSTTLRNAGVDGDVIEHMMGHTLGEVKQAYIKYDPEFLKKVYMKNYLALLIDERADASSSPEFKALKEENKELSDKNDANRSLAYQYKGRVAELEEVNEELAKSNDTQSKLMNAFMSDPSIRDLMSKIMKQTEAQDEEKENEE